MRYQNYTNLDAHYFRGYHRGDRLVKGWTGDVSDGYGLDAIYELHNQDDRPDGQLCPSMSVGDVVIVAGEAFTVAPVGWVGVAVDPADLIVDRTWTEVRD